MKGRDLRFGVCGGGLYIICDEAAEGSEGVRDRHERVGGRVGRRGCFLHRWDSEHPFSVLRLPPQLKIHPSKDPADCTLAPFSLANFTLDTKVGAVICGLDTQVTYTKLSKAFQYLTRNPGCQFLATNEDSTYPTSDGLLPGAGSISAPLRYALDKDPISIGKPASTMLDCIKAKWVLSSIPTCATSWADWDTV